LQGNQVYVLPVSEVENLFALPDVVTALASLHGFNAVQIAEKIGELKAAIIEKIRTDLEGCCIRYTLRRIDRTVKTIGLQERDIASLITEFQQQIARVDVVAIYNDIMQRVQQLINAEDIPKLLAIYDNKGLLAEVARILGLGTKKNLEEYLGRMLEHEHGEPLRRAIQQLLPQLP
jgi:hypothetical protein